MYPCKKSTLLYITSLMQRSKVNIHVDMKYQKLEFYSPSFRSLTFRNAYRDKKRIADFLGEVVFYSK
jgi:hypothetical protein